MARSVSTTSKVLQRKASTARTPPSTAVTAKPRPWSASRTSSRKSRASAANNTRSLCLGSVTKPPRGMTWTEHQRGDRLPPGVSEGGSPCYPSPEETVHDDEPRCLAAHARGAIRGPHARLGRLRRRAGRGLSQSAAPLHRLRSLGQDRHAH